MRTCASSRAASTGGGERSTPRTKGCVSSAHPANTAPATTASSTTPTLRLLMARKGIAAVVHHRRMTFIVRSINVSKAREALIDGQPVLTGIFKQPVDGPVAVRPLGLEGDEQADLSVHGGLPKAVYAYPVEHYPFWQTVRAQAGVADWGAPLAP